MYIYLFLFWLYIFICSGESSCPQHTYPRDIRVKSHHTNKVVQFTTINHDHPLFDEDGWDGEMMVYSVVKTNGITTSYDDIVLVLTANEGCF